MKMFVREIEEFDKLNCVFIVKRGNARGANEDIYCGCVGLTDHEKMSLIAPFTKVDNKKAFKV